MTPDICISLKAGKEFISAKPELIDYLSANDKRGCDYASGWEYNLHGWLLRQPEGSVALFRIFNKSIRLNNGKVQLAILAIHQLIQPYARWNQYPRYSYLGNQSSQADATQLLNKLSDIRSALWEHEPKTLPGDSEDRGIATGEQCFFS